MANINDMFEFDAAWGMLRGIRDYVIGRQGIIEADARAWFTDIETLAHNGAFFFSINRYLLFFGGQIR